MLYKFEALYSSRIKLEKTEPKIANKLLQTQ